MFPKWSAIRAGTRLEAGDACEKISPGDAQMNMSREVLISALASCLTFLRPYPCVYNLGPPLLSFPRLTKENNEKLECGSLFSVSSSHLLSTRPFTLRPASAAMLKSCTLPSFDNFPLHRAAWVGDFDDFRRALGDGADVNALDTLGRTVIMCAVAGER